MESSGSGRTVTGGMQILTDNAFDVARVARNILLSIHVGGAIDPSLGVSAQVAEYLLIVPHLRNYFPIKSIGFIAFSPVEGDWVLAQVSNNLSLDLASGGSVPLLLGGDVACVAWQIVLGENCWDG